MFNIPSVKQKFVILDARDNDIKSIAELHGSSFHRGWSASEILKLSTQPNCTLLVARRVGQPRQAVAGFNLLRTAGDEAEILSIAVGQKSRRHGIAEALMREAILRLSADSIDKLLLEVDSSNKAAIALYSKLGFETIGSRPGYYDHSSTSQPKSSALIMSLKLGP